jgi:hypothetical protein
MSQVCLAINLLTHADAKRNKRSHRADHPLRCRCLQTVLIRFLTAILVTLSIVESNDSHGAGLRSLFKSDVSCFAFDVDN